MPNNLSKRIKSQEQSANSAQKFSEMLIRVRGQRSHAEMVRILGLSNQTAYKRYEEGRIPRGDLLLEMAQKLGVSMDYLLTGQSQSDNSTEASLVVREEHTPLASSARAARIVPVISWAHAGEAEEYEEIPKDWQKEVATNCRDPLAFGLELLGDSMVPNYEQGDIAIVAPGSEPRSGGLAVAKLRENGVCFKIFNEPRGELYRLSSYNSAYLPIERPREGFHWIWPVFEVIKNVWR